MPKNDVLISKLEYILEHIHRINICTKDIKNPGDYDSSSHGITLFDATMMRLQAIGENLKKIEEKYPEILDKHTEIEWVKIIRLRDIISHHYEKLQSEIVFEICTDFIPKLKKAILLIIKENP